MKRLTKRNADGSVESTVNCQNGCQYLTCNLEEGYQCKHECEADIYLKLAEYEDLEEQGLLLKLPCKIGDTVYVVGTRCLAGEEPEEGCTFLDCEECIYDKTYIVFETKVDSMMMCNFMVCDNTNFIFGKTVFLTKEEAEKALDRLECEE